MRKLLYFLVFLYLGVLPALLFVATESAESLPPPANPKVTENLKGPQIPSTTDDQSARRAEEKKLGKPEVHQFQSDVSRVMHIIINSIYSNKDVFLRELISNASDAIDKIRYNGLLNPSELGSGEQSKLEIRIKADSEANTITISDRGVGMTKEDLISKLGTIAKSGTREFLEAVRSADMNLIGQFGVGFYSGFLVSDRITVRSKNNKDPKQWIWESTADSEFTIKEDPEGNTLGRGTEITLHLKEEASDYLEQQMLKDLIKRYSEFINFPIYLWSSEYVSVEEIDEDADLEDEDSEEVFLDAEGEEKEEKPEKKPKMKTVQKHVSDWRLQNEMKPIWVRNPREVTLEEYNNFYKTFSKDETDPLKHLHFIGEGEIDFKAILYIPSTAPPGLFEADREGQHRGLKLYVKRVFITDDFSDMFPKYLNFIKGMVDSDNLPLNVSREVLQQDRVLALIKKKLTRKVIQMMQDIAQEGAEKYNKFYQAYSTNIKYGVASDHANRIRLSKLLRFHSSKIKSLTSFDEYVTRMKDGQTQIYYLAGENIDSLEKSPYVEKLLRKGFEVIYMTDSIDEWMINSLPRFDNKYELVNASKEGFKIEGEDEQESKDKLEGFKDEYQELLDFMSEQLRGRVSRVVLSDNLVRTPSIILAGSSGYTANMERLLKAQAFNDNKQYTSMKAQRVYEINPKHPLVLELNRIVKQGHDLTSAADLVELFYETASLQSGYSIEDPATFARRIYKMMKLSLQLQLDPETLEGEDSELAQTSTETPAQEAKDEL